MTKIRDLARILGKTEAENTDNIRLLFEGETAGIDSAQTESIASGAPMKVYTGLDSLPTSGLTAGDQAYVESNNRLYISNGDGWYNIALANSTPYWDSEPLTSYEIADSATPLIIVAKARDSDNSDNNLLHQSTASDSAAFLVDITRDSSVFTFTPKSEDSIGASVTAGDLTDSNTNDFIYTFKWSDGINFVSKAVTINYNFAGPTYFISPSANGSQWQNATLYRLDAYSNHAGQSVDAVSSYNSSTYTWTIDTDQFFDGTHVTPAFSGWSSDQNYLLVIKGHDPDSGFNDRGGIYINEYLSTNTGDNYDGYGAYGSYGGTFVAGNITTNTSVASGNTNAFWLAYMRNAANTKAAIWYSANGTSWTEMCRSSTANVTRIAVSANKRQTTSTNRTLQLLDAELYGSYISINH